MPRVLSVNIARVRPNPYKDTEVTGMEKVPVSGRVHVRPPGTKLEGAGLELQVTGPRVPCATFRGWMGLRGWLKVFASSGMPGAYLRVAAAGDVGAGDAVQVVHRPDHDVAVTLVFRALLGEPHLLPSLLAADDDLPDDIRRLVERRRTVVP
jgi:MOSC domain-containing protein YiiM